MTKEHTGGDGNQRVYLVFYTAGVEISGFLSIFVVADCIKSGQNIEIVGWQISEGQPAETL